MDLPELQLIHQIVGTVTLTLEPPAAASGILPPLRRTRVQPVTIYKKRAKMAREEAEINLKVPSKSTKV
jgi:hypothetical protein